MPLPPVLALDGVPRDYAWGSTTAIATLLGQEPDGRPIAELWFGAHPDDPAPVPAHGMTLDALIESDPVGLLGADTVDRFGPRLPFLLKVLAAERALSIQVHPTLEQARQGYAAEQAAGLAPDAPDRNYRDPNHKPELLCALTPFEALCGFRPVARTLAVLDEFDLPELAPLRELLAGDVAAAPGEDAPGDAAAGRGLRTAFTYLLTLPDPAPLVAAVADRAAQLAGPDDGDCVGAARAVRVAAGDFPGDIGAVLALLLNYVRLQPGEAIYLGAGNVHAYLRGTGVEIMANSDNVLRCGLTGKHIDVPALLKITEFAELAEPRWPVQGGAGRGRFVTPAPDFALAWLDADARPQPLYRGLPQIALCTSGTAEVTADGVSVPLTPGRAAFVAAGAAAEVSAAAGARVFLASTAVQR